MSTASLPMSLTALWWEPARWGFIYYTALSPSLSPSLLEHTYYNESSARLISFLQENPITGRKADVIKAAHLCAEAALRLVKPGNQVHVTRLLAVFSMSATMTSTVADFDHKYLYVPYREEIELWPHQYVKLVPFLRQLIADPVVLLFYSPPD